MTIQDVQSFAKGAWVQSNDTARAIHSAITGDIIARAGNDTLDVVGMLDYAKTVGGPNLRRLTFHARARLLKALAQSLMAQKQALYDISFSTGATQKDHLIDIDGGIGTLFAYSSMARREMPDSDIYLDGKVERLSRNGSFLGQHVCTSLPGVAVHINAFNFPVWGMLEKLAPAILAGVPAIVKPATATSHVTELCVRLILESGLLPVGALQLVSGSLGSMLRYVSSQDVVSFTGSAETALM
ncbi:MAG: aldehyde dehydrogenase family protein, partial [Paracoccaceae bacterium]